MTLLLGCAYENDGNRPERLFEILITTQIGWVVRVGAAIWVGTVILAGAVILAGTVILQACLSFRKDNNTNLQRFNSYLTCISN